MAIKTENQIYADIIGFINNTLTVLPQTYKELQNYSYSEWQVLQLNQPVKLTEITPTIWVSITPQNNRGWQYRKYKGYGEQEEFVQAQIVKEQFIIQFSALRSRLLTDTTTTLNSVDVLKHIRRYINDKEKGLQALKQLGYSFYVPSEIQKPDFYNDSDNFEFMPFFQVTFILEQSLERPQEHINEYIIKNIERI